MIRVKLKKEFSDFIKSFGGEMFLTSLDMRASMLMSILGLTIDNFIERNYKVTSEKALVTSQDYYRKTLFGVS